MPTDAGGLSERMGNPREILQHLACPACAAHLVAGTDAAVASGSGDFSAEHSNFACPTCGVTFSASQTFVDFVMDLREQAPTASTFGFEWNGFWGGLFDKTDVFGLSFGETAEYFCRSFGLKSSDLSGLRILDAGVGSGRIPLSIASTGAYVYCVDIHDGLEALADRFGNTDNVYVVRADLFQMPFSDGFFDLAWSSGVIHHTPNPGRAFAAIARKVKPGGMLFVSVYGTDLHHYRLLRRLLPFTRFMPAFPTYLLAAFLACFLYVGFNLALVLIRIASATSKPPYRVLGFCIENIEHKSYQSILLNLFDQLHPRFQSEHSVDEVQDWFHSNDFPSTVVLENVGMVGIRGRKRIDPDPE